MASKRSRLLQANSKALQKNKTEENLTSSTSSNLVDETIAELDKDKVTKEISAPDPVEAPPASAKKLVEEKPVVKSLKTDVKAPTAPKEKNTEGIHVILPNAETTTTRSRKKNKKSNYVGIRITDKAMAAINALVELNGEESQNWVLNKHFEDLADHLNVTWERK